MTERHLTVPGTLLRRVAAHLVSERTMESVIIPGVADLQHEATLARTKPALGLAFVLARGYVAIGSALVVWAASWPGRSLREDWLQPDAPGPRLVRVLLPRAAVATAVCTLLICESTIPFAHRAADPWMLVLVLPSAAAVTVPIGFLLGLVLAVGRLTSLFGFTPNRWFGSAMGLSVVAFLVTFIVFAWVTPGANQAYRQRVYTWISGRQQTDGRGGETPRAASSPRSLVRGSRELSLSELGARIEEGLPAAGTVRHRHQSCAASATPRPRRGRSDRYGRRGVSRPTDGRAGGA
jgi:hypothetical protein